jgi:intein-encoded DNA endonuclease-like protein
MVSKAIKTRVEENFFNAWSSQMAYVLGYFCADGCMFINPRGSKYISFYSVDSELILKIKRLLKTKNKISIRNRDRENWNKLFSLQIGSKKAYSDLLKLGLMTSKAKRLSLPDIPDEYLRHFVRGYFDGDGCISYGYYKRKNRAKSNFSLMVRFASASKDFLSNLSKRLSLAVGLKRGCVCRNSAGFHLIYAKKDTMKLFNFMYNSVSGREFLRRKYNKFREAFKTMGLWPSLV